MYLKHIYLIKYKSEKCLLSHSRGSIFQNFSCHVGPSHGGPSFVTNLCSLVLLPRWKFLVPPLCYHIDAVVVIYSCVYLKFILHQLFKILSFDMKIMFDYWFLIWSNFQTKEWFLFHWKLFYHTVLKHFHHFP